MSSAFDSTEGDNSTLRGPVSFRLGPLEQSVRRRRLDGGALGSILRRDLERYYRLLDDSLRCVKLSPTEAHCVVMALRYHDLGPTSYRFLWAEVEQRIRDNRRSFVPEGCETDLLLGGLKELPHGSLMAVLDAVDQYWARVSERSTCEPTVSKNLDVSLLYDVGLTRGYFDA